MRLKNAHGWRDGGGAAFTRPKNPFGRGGPVRSEAGLIMLGKPIGRNTDLIRFAKKPLRMDRSPARKIPGQR